MVYRYETLRDDKGIVVLQSLKVSYLSLISNGFYESPKLNNWTVCVNYARFPKSGHIATYIAVQHHSTVAT